MRKMLFGFLFVVCLVLMIAGCAHNSKALNPMLGNASVYACYDAKTGQRVGLGFSEAPPMYGVGLMVVMDCTEGAVEFPLRTECVSDLTVFANCDQAVENYNDFFGF